MRTILFDAEQFIFQEGDPSGHCFWIIAGSVDLVEPGKVGSGREARGRCMTTVGPEEVFGELGLVERSPRSFSAIAREPTCCLIYTDDDIRALMADDPDRAMTFLKALLLNSARDGRGRMETPPDNRRKTMFASCVA
ncbi:MAG: hypothetical protein CML66_02190 [Rhodobacteraceae bacterium]|nr:hypothetical protein [Paracoccaceae bacterium]MAY47613.1 hypothetical protein [Paracoccaceae bacterium]